MYLNGTRYLRIPGRSNLGYCSVKVGLVRLEVPWETTEDLVSLEDPGEQYEYFPVDLLPLPPGIELVDSEN